jgi:toxin YoeB
VISISQPQCFDDLMYGERVDGDVAVKILAMIEAVRRDPFRGIGKPEPLKHELWGYWPRRITGERRLVYKVMARRKSGSCPPGTITERGRPAPPSGVPGSSPRHTSAVPFRRRRPPRIPQPADRTQIVV